MLHVLQVISAGASRAIRARMRHVRTCMSAGTYKRVQTQALTNKHKRRCARTSGDRWGWAGTSGTSGESGESENERGSARTSNNERERVQTGTSKRGQARTKTNEDKRGGRGCRRTQALRTSANADKCVQTQACTNECERGHHPTNIHRRSPPPFNTADPKPSHAGSVSGFWHPTSFPRSRL